MSDETPSLSGEGYRPDPKRGRGLGLPPPPLRRPGAFRSWWLQPPTLRTSRTMQGRLVQVVEWKKGPTLGWLAFAQEALDSPTGWCRVPHDLIARRVQRAARQGVVRTVPPSPHWPTWWTASSDPRTAGQDGPPGTEAMRYTIRAPGWKGRGLRIRRATAASLAASAGAAPRPAR